LPKGSYRWLGGRTVRLLFIAMMVVGLIGFVSMVAYVLAH
jgi:phage shock protein PspC (stress-responsive transcriptional regulator)